MPTDDDLAKDLTAFRIAAERKFISIEQDMNQIQSELRWIGRLIGFLAVMILVVMLGWWRVIWDAATIRVDVLRHTNQLDAIIERLEAMDRKLDLLIRAIPRGKDG